MDPRRAMRGVRGGGCGYAGRVHRRLALACRVYRSETEADRTVCQEPGDTDPLPVAATVERFLHRVSDVRRPGSGYDSPGAGDVQKISARRSRPRRTAPIRVLDLVHLIPLLLSKLRVGGDDRHTASGSVVEQVRGPKVPQPPSRGVDQ